jgi:hypothetical protein
MMKMFSPQNIRNVIALGTLRPSNVRSPPSCPKLGQMASRKVRTASPPRYAWMPNQPQATMARSTAGTLAPVVPKDERASTGNGMP